MDDNVNGEPVSFDSHRAKYFERQSKAQAATIIDLEAKIAYLEVKVEHLDGCLQRERARNHLGISPDAPPMDSPRASSDATSSRYDTVAFSSSSQESKLTLKRPASPEPALFTILPSSLKKKLANPEKKMKTEHKSQLCVPANGVYLRNEAGRNFMFLSPDYHAYVPTQPGGPGVLLSICFPPDWSDGIQTVFAKLPGGLQNRRTKYVYLGEYQLIRDQPMTASEFVGLSSETKKTLALRILYDDIFKDIQKRIIPDFRRPHVSGALAHERSLTLTELKRAEAGEAMETVLAAYRQGKERLDVWLLRCMSFDEMLLRDIAKLKT
ncbi:hypothetical protein ACG7TL_001836 [Trametes sanguinea]